MSGQIGVKLRIDQVDNATRTARYREGDFQCRTSAWTNDISDPSQITSYFAYFPNIESLHSGYQDKRIDELFLKSQEENNPETRRAQYKEIQETYNGAAPIMFLYETPYPVAFRDEGQGVRADPARQQPLRSGLRREVSSLECGPLPRGGARRGRKRSCRVHRASYVATRLSADDPDPLAHRGCRIRHRPAAAGRLRLSHARRPGDR